MRELKNPFEFLLPYHVKDQKTFEKTTMLWFNCNNFIQRFRVSLIKFGLLVVLCSSWQTWAQVELLVYGSQVNWSFGCAWAPINVKLSEFCLQTRILYYFNLYISKRLQTYACVQIGFIFNFKKGSQTWFWLSSYLILG